jgi:hypothetical protein
MWFTGQVYTPLHIIGEKMKTTKKISIALLAFVILLSACQRNVTRNNDGSADVETVITQQELQDVITSSIADPLVKDITVSLQPGYISVSGTHQRLNDASKTDNLSFRLDLGVSNGALTASISNAQIDGILIEQNRVDNWNQTIANRIANFGNKGRNSTLKSVSITTSQVTMTWTVAK